MSRLKCTFRDMVVKHQFTKTDQSCFIVLHTDHWIITFNGFAAINI